MHNLSPHRFFGSLVLSASVLALAAPAAAQTATQEADTDQGSGDIVVVAQGRAQALSDVPVAVSAVSADALANSGANDIRQLNQVAPSLLVSSTGSEANSSARIRGVGTVGDNPGLESSVAVFIDGVYRSRSGIGMSDLGEIDRIEVLRGPQGTLGGRNSSAGMINIYSKKPEFRFGGFAEASYGNYDAIRLAAGLTGPITEQLAFRLDGVFSQRDGFARDPNNDTRINDRDRYFVRGQLLWEPSDSVSLRLIGDYTHRDESCCSAIFVSRDTNPYIGGLNDTLNPTTVGNNMVNELIALGQPASSFNPGYNRTAWVTPGRNYNGQTKDWGLSAELNWDLGGARLTSITGYRDYRATQAGDLDYNAVDILYRPDNDGLYRQFRTFTQELRLQGEAFGGRLDWMVGGYYANETLTLNEATRFGEDYGRFASCRLIGGVNAGLMSPTSSGCLSAGGRAALGGLLGPATTPILAAIDRLDTMSDIGAIRDHFRQRSTNWALFTHNIINLTDRLDLTLGLRYTNERKRLNASFENDNNICTQNQAALGSLLANPALQAVAGGIIGLSCQGNSTIELNGQTLTSRRSEDEFTGTAILSYRPTDDLMVYASYSRGYKAGGFNLDRSALKNPVFSFASQGGVQALADRLQFEPEMVNAFEIGAKYSTREFSLSIAAFRQDFENFQLNTFDGTSYIVQNINGCTENLNGADRDQSKFPTAPNYNAAAAASGACAPNNVGWGLRSQGFEIEASLVPARNFRVAAGLTYADTQYRSNLVGTSDGTPLNQALRMLPGQNMSNAPELVTTASMTWTPPIGSSGMTGLVYVDTRMTSDFNTGSDLFPQKAQDGYTIVNARLGLRGDQDRWAVEFWAQNLFNKHYAQVAFNSPFQEGGVSPAFTDAQYPGGRQLFSMFLGEPRTYGITVRTRF